MVKTLWGASMHGLDSHSFRDGLLRLSTFIVFVLLTSGPAAAKSLYCSVGDIVTWQGTVTFSGSMNSSEGSANSLWRKQAGQSQFTASLQVASKLPSSATGGCVDDTEYSPSVVNKTQLKALVQNASGSANFSWSDNYCEGSSLVHSEGTLTSKPGAAAANASAAINVDIAKGVYSLVVWSGKMAATGESIDCSAPKVISDDEISAGSVTTADGAIPPTGAWAGQQTTKDANGWTYVVSWQLTPTLRAPTYKDDTVDDSCQKSGSIIGCENQSLGETIPITGTQFSLNYRSERVAGRLRANAVGVDLAKDLGGWSLTPYHRYDPVENRLYRGDGQRRSSATLGKLRKSATGTYLIADDDGIQVHEFAADGTHLRTRHALTGAVIHQFAVSAGRLISIADPYGNVTAIQRDAGGKPTAIVAPFGQTTRIVTDANGYLAEVFNPAGTSIKLRSTASGLLTAFTRAGGATSSFEYDEEGRLVRDTGPTGGVQTLARMGSSIRHYQVTHTSAAGTVTGFDVSPGDGGKDNRVIRDPAGGVTKLSGAIEGITMPDGMRASADAGDDPRFGATRSFTSNAMLTAPSQLTMMTIGQRTATLVDPKDPFSLVEQTEKFTINGFGDGPPPIPGVTLPVWTGRTTVTRYDAATRTTVETSPSGQVSTSLIDNNGRLVQLQRVGLAPQNFAYDARGRLARLSTGNGANERSLAMSFDDKGWLSAVTDTFGQSTKFLRDPLGRIVSKQLPGNANLGFAYDADDHLTLVTTPSGAAHRFTYDSTGLLSAYAAPDLAGARTITSYSYDPDRRIQQIKWPDGRQVDFSRDAAGRVSTITTPDGVFHYSYSPTMGSLAAVETPGGVKSSFTFDGSLMIGEAWSGAVSGSVSNSLDNEFRTQQQALNGADPVARTYDADGRLSAAGAITLQRDARNGLLTGSKIAGVEDSIEYNEFAHVTRYEAKAKGKTVLSRDYTYDLNDRIASVTESVFGVVVRRGYLYDAAGQLSSVTLNDVVVAKYQYDANRNRIRYENKGRATVAAVDLQDRLLSFGTRKYGYNASGQMTSLAVSGKTSRFAYDAFGNLASVKLPGGRAITYLVDAFDRRVGKQVGGKLTAGYLYDGPRVVAQLDGANKLVSRFVYASHSNTPDYMVRDGKTYRILTDHLHSPRLVIDVATGEVAQRIDYDEFGVVTRDTRPGFQPFGFVGGLYDPDTGLVHFGAREYAAETGRWTSKDPILFSGGDANLYRYVHGDPVNKTDTTGLQTTEELWVMVIKTVRDAYKVTAAQARQMLENASDVEVVWSRADGRPGAPRHRPGGGGGPMLIIVTCGRELMETINRARCQAGDMNSCSTADLMY